MYPCDSPPPIIQNSPIWPDVYPAFSSVLTVGRCCPQRPCKCRQASWWCSFSPPAGSPRLPSKDISQSTIRNTPSASPSAGIARTARSPTSRCIWPERQKSCSEAKPLTVCEGLDLCVNGGHSISFPGWSAPTGRWAQIHGEGDGTADFGRFSGAFPWIWAFSICNWDTLL